MALRTVQVIVLSISLVFLYFRLYFPPPLPSLRCPPVLEMLLRVLAAYTSASRAWLLDKCHTQNSITVATSAGSTDSSAAGLVSDRLSVAERKELCVALTAAQESAVVQFLLEMCLPDDKEEEKKEVRTVHMESLGGGNFKWNDNLC